MTKKELKVIKAINESKNPLFTVLANIMWLAQKEKEDGQEQEKQNK